MKLSTLAAAALLSLLVSVLCQAAEPLDGIAAVVNKDVIKFARVRELTVDAEAQARRELSGDALQAKIKEIRCKAINDLIARKRAEQDVNKAK